MTDGGLTVRRVVTGHDGHGESQILSDAPSPQFSDRAKFAEIWNTEGSPARITAVEQREPSDRPPSTCTTIGRLDHPRRRDGRAIVRRRYQRAVARYRPGARRRGPVESDPPHGLDKRCATPVDAAHATTPHMAAGALIDIQDAVVLSEELQSEQPVDAVLEAFYGAALRALQDTGRGAPTDR